MPNQNDKTFLRLCEEYKTRLKEKFPEASSNQIDKRAARLAQKAIEASPVKPNATTQLHPEAIRLAQSSEYATQGTPQY